MEGSSGPMYIMSRGSPVAFTRLVRVRSLCGIGDRERGKRETEKIRERLGERGKERGTERDWER